MVGERVADEREDMEIDGVKSEKKTSNEIPDGFNANFLKIYYGNFVEFALNLFVNLIGFID